MRELISHGHVIPNPVFNIDWINLSDSLYYYDKATKTNYLFIIHRDGIVKYNLDEDNITEKYNQFINNEYMIKNECCLDPNHHVIYMDIYSEKKIITFNIKSKNWNLNFLNYSHQKPRVIYGAGLSFLPSPIGEVRLQLVHLDPTFSIFKISEKGQLERLEVGSLHECNFKHNLKFMDHHLYVLKSFKISKFDQIVQNILFRRDYRRLVLCHFAWNQIIFFVFRVKGSHQYSIDCVNLLEPMKVYFDIKRFKRSCFDAVCVDQGNHLHHVYLGECWVNEKVHSTISFIDIIPDIIIQKKRKENYSLIYNLCSFYSKKYRLYIPIVLIYEINKFYEVF